MIIPHHREHAGKLSNHQDPSQKIRFQKRLLMKKPVSTSYNPVCHSYHLEGKIVRPHLTKNHFQWSKRTSQMEHNCRTNFRPRKQTTLVQHLVTTRNQIPKPRLNPSTINSGKLHPIFQSKPLAVYMPVYTQENIDR